MSSAVDAIEILSSSSSDNNEDEEDDMVVVDGNLEGVAVIAVARMPPPPPPPPPRQSPVPSFCSYDTRNLLLTFGIEGNPCPLARSRFFNGGFFGPSRSKMIRFKSILREALIANHVNGGPGGLPFNGPVSVKVWFYMKRPNDHFVGRRRASGNLRFPVAMRCPWSSSSRGPDIDNLLKFVLDAMNGIVYRDDGQVAKILAMKPMDNHNECPGRTIIQVQPLLDFTNPPPVSLSHHFPI